MKERKASRGKESLQARHSIASQDKDSVHAIWPCHKLLDLNWRSTAKLNHGSACRPPSSLLQWLGLEFLAGIRLLALEMPSPLPNLMGADSLHLHNVPLHVLTCTCTHIM
eukprot:323760-Pelagomonas_calceolata.AAC.8